MVRFTLKIVAANPHPHWENNRCFFHLNSVNYLAFQSLARYIHVYNNYPRFPA